ncbi:polysaccharide biosynthesis C-terminal domain-containing protein [Vibrio fluvialis]|uniref:MATE family efflux transporter n=1 Tax=Vibrio fluvialis TaxID=676 RepID=UPI001EECBF31|nr:MATE family efflux transporter [Vibrio fluvialis]MCG6405531.1 polysaccharide biosynthesis C-terminal domain-containing protein [Vibrio fluvialis]
MSKKNLDHIIRINRYKNTLYQVVMTLASFGIYPVLYGYLDENVLGVWLTLMSVASWIMIFDVGVGNGLRNKIAPLIDSGDVEKTKKYMSSTYFFFFLFLFFLCLIILFSVYQFSNVYVLFNTKKDLVPDLMFSFLLLLITIFSNLFFSLNFSVANAFQNSSFLSFRNSLFNVLLLGCLFFTSLYSNAKGSLLDVTMLFFLANLITNLFTTMHLFLSISKVKPSIRYICFSYFKDNLKVGSQFFIINLTSIVLFSSDTFLISHLFEPKEVTSYSVTIKAFTIFLLIMWIYLGPLWSAYTVKWDKEDYNWVFNKLNQSIKLTVVICLAMLGFSLIFDRLLYLWIGDDSLYNSKLALSVFLLTGLRIWSGNFSTLLNGLGVVKVQMYCSIFAIILNIPISIILVKNYNLGIEGVAIGTVLSLAIFSIVGPIYVYRLRKIKIITE